MEEMVSSYHLIAQRESNGFFEQGIHILSDYLLRPDLVEEMERASNDHQRVLELAEELKTLLPLTSLPKLSDEAKVEVINHVLEYTYQRIILARRHESLLTKGTQDKTYGEIESRFVTDASYTGSSADPVLIVCSKPSYEIIASHQKTTLSILDAALDS
jgi:hypothetical protein